MRESGLEDGKAGAFAPLFLSPERYDSFNVMPLRRKRGFCILLFSKKGVC